MSEDAATPPGHDTERSATPAVWPEPLKGTWTLTLEFEDPVTVAHSPQGWSIQALGRAAATGAAGDPVGLEQALSQSCSPMIRRLIEQSEPEDWWTIDVVTDLPLASACEVLSWWNEEDLEIVQPEVDGELCSVYAEGPAPEFPEYPGTWQHVGSLTWELAQGASATSSRGFIERVSFRGIEGIYDTDEGFFVEGSAEYDSLLSDMHQLASSPDYITEGDAAGRSDKESEY